MLSATPGFKKYEWNNGSTTNSTTATGVGYYAVVVTDNNNCTTTANEFIYSGNALNYNFSPSNAKVCKGNNLALSVIPTGASTGYTYRWSTGANTAFTDINQPGTYKVTISNGQCTKKDSVKVGSLAGVSISIIGNTQLCKGQSTTLSVNSADSSKIVSYKWDFNNATSKSINVNKPQVYNVTITDQSGCTNTASATVSVSNILNVNIQGTANAPVINNKVSLCTGQSVQLSTIGGDKFLWNDNSTNSILNTNKAGIYSVTASNTAGCIGQKSVEVIINPIPDISISGNKTFCEKSNTTLNAIGTGTFLWSNNNTTQNIVVNKGGIYTVTLTDKGCNNKSSITVSEIPLPNILIEGDSSVCNGAAASLTAKGGASYRWNTGETIVQIAPTQIGNYTVTVTSAEGCSSSKSVKVTEVTALMPTIVGKTELCKGAKDTLKATLNNTWSYLWNDKSTSSSLPINAAGTYKVTVTSKKGCKGEATFDVVVHNLPDVNITGDKVICEGKTATLQAIGNATNYKWNDGSIASTFSTTAKGTYSVTATSAKGCTATTSIILDIIPLPKPIITGSTLLCNGNPTMLKVEGGVFSSYIWNNQITTPSIEVNTVGTYLVTVTNSSGCIGTTSINVTQGKAIAPSIIGASSFCEGKDIVLKVTGGDTYIWSLNNIKSDTIKVNASGTYSVTASSTNGCTGTNQKTITQLNAPKAIFSGDLVICKGALGILTVSGGLSYLWNTGSSGSQIPFNEAKTYTVTLTDNNTCTSVASQKTDFYASQKTNIQGATALCGTATTTLTATGGVSYIWNTGDKNPKLQNIGAGYYAVTSTDVNGCKDSSNVTVKTSNQKLVSYNDAICEGAQYIFGGKQYNKSGTYCITTTTKSGCDSSYCVNLSVVPKIKETNLDTTICENLLPFNYAGKPYNTTGVYPIKRLSTNGCDSIVNLKLTVLDQNSINMSNKIILLKENTKDTTLELFPANRFSTKIKITIKQPDDATITYIAPNKIRYKNANGFKEQTVISYTTCYEKCTKVCSVADITLSLPPLPDLDDCITELGDKVYNGITPNGNEKNEYFDPLGDLILNNCPVDASRAELRIVNPWGDVIFRAKPYQKWYGTKQGTSDGTPIEDGIYYYILIVKKPDGKKEKQLSGKLMVVQPK
jgi:hypothetical protein